MSSYRPCSEADCKTSYGPCSGAEVSVACKARSHHLIVSNIEFCCTNTKFKSTPKPSSSKSQHEVEVLSNSANKTFRR